ATVCCDRIVKPHRNSLERLVPRNADELAAALRSHSAQWVQNSFRRACVVQVVGNLVAQRSAGVRVRWIAAKSDRFAMFHRDDPTARVGAIERTGSADLTAVVFLGHQYPILHTGLSAK